jgi:microcystin-dependent protein
MAQVIHSAQYVIGGNMKFFKQVIASILTCGMTLFTPLAYGAATKESDKLMEKGLMIPTGTIMPFAGSVAPSGWVMAYGQEVSQTSPTYAYLYAVIGSTYCTTEHGGTCTAGNFRLPDLRGRFIGGKDDMGGSAASRITSAVTIDGTILGKSGGSQSQASNVTVGNHTFTQPSAHVVTQPVLNDHTFTQPSAHGNISIDHGHTFNQPSAHGITQPTFNTPAHYHGTGTISISTVTTSNNNGGSAPWHDGGSVRLQSGSNLGGGITTGGVKDAWHTHTFSVPNGNFAGNVGNTGGSAGDAAFGNARTTDVALTNNHAGGSVVSLSGSSVALTNNHSGGAVNSHSLSTQVSLSNNHSGGAVDAHSVSNNAVNNLSPTVILNYIIKL